MPKHLSLFGRWLRGVGKTVRAGLKKKNLIRPVPVKAMGRTPSASSQTGLYHDEDFNYRTKVSKRAQKTRQMIKPNWFRKAIHSENLNYTIPSIRVTTSALHAMDDAGGFDEYIMRTPPQELRSHLGERLRDVMYYYKERPEVRSWGLPWKVFFSKEAQADPEYARHLHFARKHRNEAYWSQRSARMSPYYLPGNRALYPERQPFIEGSEEPCQIDKWWESSPAMEEAFRRRLLEARGFEKAYYDSMEPGAFRMAHFGRGGGGQHGNFNPTRKRSKVYKFHETRPF